MEELKINRNKPADSAFKQQKLPAWQPILTADTVLPTFFLIGIAFIPIGVGLLISSNQVQEKIIDYTQCRAIGYAEDDTCARLIAQNITKECECEISFTLTEDFKRDVFIYYGLSNFYQNHRRYVRSRDDSQLYGAKSVSKDCEPFAYKKVNGQNMPIAPCGAVANSMFNDSFAFYELNEETPDTAGFSSNQHLINVFHTGIAWATDKNSKFRNPPGKNLTEAFQDFTNPPNWRDKMVYELDVYDSNDNGYLNEAFIVWMRTAALPTFRKLYARIDHTSTPKFHNSLPKGDYKIRIKYNYPVFSFKGTKRIIISNTSWLGGKNPFLGIAYIVVGAVCLVLSAIFLFIHKKFGKKTSDLISVTTRTPYIN